MHDESRITAIHEAAHAVAAIRCGLIFDHVTAVPDEREETDGALHWDELQAAGDLEVAPELLAVVLLAGPCAEAKLLGRPPDQVFVDEVALDDRESIAALSLDPRQFLAASRDAFALIDEDWPLIERLADELEDVDLLYYDEVEALVADSDAS
jgi:hypothetical protein